MVARPDLITCLSAAVRLLPGQSRIGLLRVGYRPSSAYRTHIIGPKHMRAVCTRHHHFAARLHATVM